MAPISKQSRPTQDQVYEPEVVDNDFDFGDPEIVGVEIHPGKFLYLREPSAEDLISIDKVYKNKDLDDVEHSLAVICILHSPEPGKRRLSMKDAKRLRSRQIKALNDAIGELMGIKTEENDGDEEENSSNS